MRRTLEATSLLMTLACWGLIAPDVEAAETQEIGAEASASLTADEDELEADGSSESSGSSDSVDSSDSSGSSGSSGSSDSSGSSGSSSSGNMGDLSGKKLRLHLETDVLSFSMQTNGGNTITDIGFGIGRPTAPDGIVFAGFSQPLVSIGLGAIILDGHGAVGGQAAMSLDAVPNGGGVLIGGHIIGYFNYMFDTYGRIKPFVGGRLGFGGADAGGFGAIYYPLIGAQGGIHLFLLEPVSLDIALALDYAPILGSGGLAFHGINISIPRLGLSTWF